MTLLMDRDELSVFMKREFPQVQGDFTVDHVDEDKVLIRLNVSEKHLRPGGTVSGPSMFSLADVSIYLAVLSRIGAKALTVTTSCSIDFMRKPEAGKDLIATGRLLKLGRALAVGDVMIRSDGSEAIVARASVTYSIPPKS